MTEEIEMKVLSLSGSSEDETWRRPHEFPEPINFQLNTNKTEVRYRQCGFCNFLFIH